MPLPRRPSLCSIADTYRSDAVGQSVGYFRPNDEFIEGELRDWYGGPQQPSKQEYCDYNDITVSEEGFQEPISRSRSSSSVATSQRSVFSIPKSEDTSLMQGYFLDQGPRSRCSSSVVFSGNTSTRTKKPLPPGVLLRRSIKQSPTPGPGSYNPVFSMLAKKSPYC